MHDRICQIGYVNIATNGMYMLMQRKQKSLCLETILSTQDKWFYNGMKIDVVDSFSYLGVHLFYNGKFTRTQNVLASQGRKSMFHTLKICNENVLNTETKLHLARI